MIDNPTMSFSGLVASRDPDVHSGDLVFTGTRVPVNTFVEFLKDGGSVDEFLGGFPTVARWQAESLLEMHRTSTGARVCRKDH